MLLISTSFHMKMKGMRFYLSSCARTTRSYENIDKVFIVFIFKKNEFNSFAYSLIAIFQTN